MKKNFVSMFTTVLVFAAGSGIAIAQDDGPPNFVPVEMQVCNYEDGMDGDDLEDALDEMVDWMEENDGDPYAAWILRKYYAGPDREFDYIYLGAWPNGSTMGRDSAHYIDTASDAIEAFGEVADCNGSFLYGSLEVKAPPESDGQTDGFILTFSDCKVSGNRSTGNAIAAVREYSAYRDANGSPGGTYLLFPAYGGGAGDFDFKLVNSYPSIQAFGDNFQWIVENAAYTTSEQMMGGVMDCDTARVYIGDTVVNTIATMDN